jgi:hypothetical protein
MFLELKEFQYFVWLPACYAYILSMVPRWYIFIPKDQILEYFWNLRMETVSWHFYSHLVYFIAIWYILWVIWYILLPFWYCEPRKFWQPCFGVPKRGTTETVLEKTGCCTYASIIFKLKLNRFIFRGIFEIARTKSICTFIHLFRWPAVSGEEEKNWGHIKMSTFKMPTCINVKKWPPYPDIPPQWLVNIFMLKIYKLAF